MPTHADGIRDAVEDDSIPLYADVIVPRGPARAFTYLIPSTFRTKLAIGHRVVVPFRATTMAAVVTALYHELPSGIEKQQVKAIQSLATPERDCELSSAQLELSRRLSARFLAPWGQCVKLLSPPIQLPAKSQAKWVITPEGRRVLSSADKLAPVQRGMLERLAHRASGLTWQTLNRSRGDSALHARTALVRRGLIAQGDGTGSVVPRATGGRERPVAHPQPSSGPSWWRKEGTGQDAVASPAHMQRLWDSGQGGTVLLQACRENRMRILTQAVRETLHRKRSVLIVTGEITRAQEIRNTLAYAEIAPVHLIHGNLSIRERILVWQRVRSGDATVVVGTRSAVCCPVQNLGLVWVDDEEDAALKEEQSPRYHAREVARMRAQLDQGILVLGSANPSLESLHAAMTGQALLWCVPDSGDHARAELVDLRRFPAGTLMTPPIIDGIRTALAERRLVILFLNRKGYASLLLCRACGQAPSCPACSLALRFHKRLGSLICHCCGLRANVPDVCPACQAVGLEPVGGGTERVEELLRRHFPQIRVGMMDGEVIRRSAQADSLVALACAGEIDVIIGTQKLFLYREVPRAGLVGILNADAGLHMPDFRAAEHTYHVLRDAVSLSDTNGDGKVIIQTHLPHHHALQAIIHDKPALFIDTELAFRQALQYPPFTHLVRLDVSGTSERHVRLAAEHWAAALQRSVDAESRTSDGTSSFNMETTVRRSVSVLGPAPAPLPRARRRYRWQLLVRSSSQEHLLKVVKETLPDMEQLPRSGGIRCSVDVDPLTML